MLFLHRGEHEEGRRVRKGKGEALIGRDRHLIRPGHGPKALADERFERGERLAA